MKILNISDTAGCTAIDVGQIRENCNSSQNSIRLTSTLRLSIKVAGCAIDMNYGISIVGLGNEGVGICDIH